MLTTPLRGNKSQGGPLSANTTPAKILFQSKNSYDTSSLTSTSTMASKTSNSSEQVINPYVQTIGKYLAVSPEAKVARDILHEREKPIVTTIIAWE